MDRPRLFLSTVSEELKTARQAVARTIRTLGFDPVSQDDFPTGYGELRQWLREQLDSCESLIQLVGDGYGVEPPDIDPEYGRVSYTQLEFLYAHKQKKKTWIIVIGKDFPRDKPPDQLDLPRDPGHLDLIGYQAERRALQQKYLVQLGQETHLRLAAYNETELEEILLRLHDELGELGKLWLAKEDLRKILSDLSAARLEEANKSSWSTPKRILSHLRQTVANTYRRDLDEAEQSSDWARGYSLRRVAQEVERLERSKIHEIATFFYESEGRETVTGVSKEMTYILAEQGVDEAIAYIKGQRTSLLQHMRTRTAGMHENNRANLELLLQTAALFQAKGDAAGARALYTDILTLDPDWPEALHAVFGFHVLQGYLAWVRATLVEVRYEYEEAHRIAKHLVHLDANNSQWQWDLSVGHELIGNVLMAQGDMPAAFTAYRVSLTILETLVKRDPENIQWQIHIADFCTRLGKRKALPIDEQRIRVQRSLRIRQDLKARGLLLPYDDSIVYLTRRLKKLEGQ